MSQVVGNPDNAFFKVTGAWRDFYPFSWDSNIRLHGRWNAVSPQSVTHYMYNADDEPLQSVLGVKLPPIPETALSPGPPP